jgi:putative oxidoreductase
MNMQPTRIRDDAAQNAVLDRALEVARRFGPVMLRVSLAVVFVWFGALKVFDVTPVGDLVANTVPFLPEGLFVPALGIVEVALGAALVMGRSPWIAAGVAAHLAGTFLALVTQPEVAFQNGNLLLLTTEGEFVIKNLVLIAAALTVAGHTRAERVTEENFAKAA